MKYGIDSSGARIEATKGGRATCDGCDQDLVAKCGSIVVNHWAHRADRECDLWYEPEGEWHRSWKALVRADAQEITMKRDGQHHRADIVGDRGRVIELQHSPISAEEIQAREQFYGQLGRMTWLFDCTEKRDRMDPIGTDRKIAERKQREAVSCPPARHSRSDRR